VESLKLNGFARKATKLAVILARFVASSQHCSLLIDSASNFPYWSLGDSSGCAEDEPWIGHPFDPINVLFDCLVDECRGGPPLRSAAPRLLALAVEVALIACARPRPTTSCRHATEKVAGQEERLLGKLKKMDLQRDDQLLSVVRHRALQLLEGAFDPLPRPSPWHHATAPFALADSNDSYNAILNANMYLPLSSLANFFFHVFLYKDPDLAYKIGLEAFK